jgi:DinB superfamily
MFLIEPPTGRDDSLAGLERLSGELVGFLDGFTDEAFFAAQGDHWSPAVHLRHLTKSVRVVGDALQKWKPMLLVFGRPGRPSRSYEEVVAAYVEALDRGGKAGRFAPRGEDPERHLVVAGWQLAGRGLQRAANRWSEKALDRYQLPHPLLGKLTVREMLFFTLYHNAHHARRIRERALGGRY